MLKTLIIFLYFGTNVLAGSIALTSTAAAQEEVELAKISATCLSSREFEELGGNIVRHGVVRGTFGRFLLREGVDIIGLAELRAALDFPPLPPWGHSNYKVPSEEELSAAPSIEAYYNLKEPRSWEASIPRTFLFEHNMIPAIAFMDKRFPVIRSMYRRRFGEILQQDPGSTDRKMIDRLIDEFEKIRYNAGRATSEMFGREECWDFEKMLLLSI
ncbi:unnamed protein product [Caenorhabditis brenneri]